MARYGVNSNDFSRVYHERKRRSLPSRGAVRLALEGARDWLNGTAAATGRVATTSEVEIQEVEEYPPSVHLLGN